MSNTNNSSGGVGFFGFLTLIFITLKLTHVINWTWPWVLAPLWIPLAVVGVGLVVALIIYLVSEIFKDKKAGRKTRW